MRTRQDEPPTDAKAQQDGVITAMIPGIIQNNRFQQAWGRPLVEEPERVEGQATLSA